MDSKEVKLILIYFCVILISEEAKCAMTEAQVKSAVKLMKQVCQPKSKITNDQLDGLHQGTFTEEKEVLSYVECVLRTGQIMKDAKLNYDFLRAQLINLPPSISDGAIISAEHCKDVKSSDKYMAAYEFYKCFYEDNPSNFFLP